MKSKQESEILIEELSQEIITVAETFCKMNYLKDLRDYANIITQSFMACLSNVIVTDINCIKKLTENEMIKLNFEIHKYLAEYFEKIMERESK